ncbi:MAG: ComF family protein [Ignavibacteriae bacterium]|nr:ComF family protein [Ignavibacteriota bacterium]
MGSLLPITLRPMDFVRSIVRPIREFIYPPVCFVCDAPLTESNSRVCGQCWTRIRPVDSEDELYRVMSDRLRVSGSIAHLVSAYHFEKDGVLQSLIHQLKYEAFTRIGIELGEKLGGVVAAMAGFPNVYGIIPVPLHRLKERERGYNQSEFICKGISNVTGLQVCPALLFRKKYTRSQTQLNAAERKENVGDAFEATPFGRSVIQGHTFIVADDVITTGATIEACARVLKANGARSVIAASVALAE